MPSTSSLRSSERTRANHRRLPETRLSPSSNLTGQFAAIFKGRLDAYGAVHGEAVKVPVTLRSYSRHLSGNESLGIYPLLDDASCHWSAADIDHPEPDPPRALIDALDSLGLNRGLYLERSRA